MPGPKGGFSLKRLRVTCFVKKVSKVWDGSPASPRINPSTPPASESYMKTGRLNVWKVSVQSHGGKTHAEIRAKTHAKTHTKCVVAPNREEAFSDVIKL